LKPRFFQPHNRFSVLKPHRKASSLARNGLGAESRVRLVGIDVDKNSQRVSQSIV
jgi:hypothetical protein